ncbi:MAG: hypothetical protein GX765_04605 [Candidatus Moranbacteria bacterium]|nr:hypothetical protein [Candidatus Moranbacteria bacterium]
MEKNITKKSFLILFLGIFLFFLNLKEAKAEYINLPKDENGWTIFNPSADTRIMYVSASGNDSIGQIYSSTSPEVGSDPFRPGENIQPFATYAAAFANAREGYPDWILMKRGDVFYESVGYSRRNGRSLTEPFLIGAYGDSGRSPIFKTGTSGAINGIKYQRYLAVSGIDFYAHTRDPKGAEYVGIDGGSGIALLGGETTLSEGILIEGCKFRSYIVNHIQGYGNSNGVTIRRNIFLDSYSEGQGHSQGLYSYNMDNFLLEENIFDHNGWHSQAGSGQIGSATIFNHNTYFGNMKNTSFFKNIFLRSSSIQNKFTANIGYVRSQSNTGNGSVSSINVADASQVQFGNYELVCTSKVQDGGIFNLKAPDNSFLPDVTVGSSYSNVLSFSISDGSVDFELGDSFIIEIKEGFTSDLDIIDNLYVDGEIGMSVGGNSNSPNKFKNVEIRDNVLTEIGRSRPTNRTLGWGIDILDNTNALCVGNINVHNNNNLVTNVYGFNIGGSAREVELSNNIIYNIGGTGLYTESRYPGTSRSGVDIINNFFREDSISVNSINLIDKVGIVFSNNQYYTPKTNPFTINSTAYDFLQWQAETGDNSSFSEPYFPDPTRSIETYMASFGETPTIDAFIEKCRLQDRYNWDIRFTAEAVNNHIRAGFIDEGSIPPGSPTGLNII